ncbi:TetR/AcrR family transcriptional regulator [Microbacterium sp. STN6]|uniref:TetR/AcrR family transcriptional regulator n=1 Tax=Microbacterium sp. STN6 TaxID=2995588 RepID=UPI002260A8AC|nr:TetR/AcrR family transcriptional regulator [Microbacterium sp. STN6]MCX7522042.1 TetR/AcrR family transcriptional regulator [Microbacterium sp. STN6]
MVRGRPRRQATDDAILAAVIELAGEAGYGGVTFDAVAVRAGVSRPTIYRRWPSKSHMIAAALHAVAPREPVADTGNGLDDLIMMVSRLQMSLVDTGLIGAFIQLMAGTAPAATRDQARAQAHAHAGDEPIRNQYFSPRFSTFDELCARAVARGELPAGTDPTVMRDLVLGPLAYRWLVEGALDAATVEILVESAWRALTTAPPTPRADAGAAPRPPELAAEH